jgi:hypothetical protein
MLTVVNDSAFFGGVLSQLTAGIVYGTVLVIIVLVVALRFLFIDSVG